jgi:hypothetical protein
MPLNLNLAILESRKESAIRTAKKAVVRLAPSEWGQKLKRFAGFAFGAVIKFFNLSFDQLWDMLVNAYFALKQFDWNAMDSELEKQIEANNKRILNQGAQALGEYMGFGVFRVATFFAARLGSRQAKAAQAAQAQGFKVPVFAARASLALAEEGNEELMANFRMFLQTTIQAQLSNAFIRFVLTARKEEWFGMKSITKPQADGSIQSKIDKQIEKLPEFWRQPIENLIEGFEDGLIEAGYVMSMTADDVFAINRHARQESGPYRTVEIKPEKGSEETLVFRGSQSDVIEAIRTVIPTRQLIEDRDIGQFLGEPHDETITLKPQLRVLHITSYTKEAPPYKKQGKWIAKRATITVPDARVGLKRADILGAVKNYQGGHWFVHCRLDNGRQMQGWFASPGEGKEVLNALARLSTADIDQQSFRWSDGAATGKQSERYYPALAAITSPKRKNGKVIGPLGKPERIPLWGERAGRLN